MRIGIAITLGYISAGTSNYQTFIRASVTPQTDLLGPNTWQLKGVNQVAHLNYNVKESYSLLFNKKNWLFHVHLFSDFLIIILSYKLIGDLFTVTHHLMAIWAYYFVVVSTVKELQCMPRWHPHFWIKTEPISKLRVLSKSQN